jgi:hypothetical protein
MMREPRVFHPFPAFIYHNLSGVLPSRHTTISDPSAYR